MPSPLKVVGVGILGLVIFNAGSCAAHEDKPTPHYSVKFPHTTEIKTVKVPGPVQYRERPWPTACSLAFTDLNEIGRVLGRINGEVGKSNDVLNAGYQALLERSPTALNRATERQLRLANQLGPDSNSFYGLLGDVQSELVACKTKSSSSS